MSKGHIKRIVGSISDDVVEQYKLYDYRGIEIVQSLDLYSHVHKHIHEFKSVDSYNKAILNIDKIIANPYFVYYERKRNSLHYFAELDEFTCVIVKISLKKNKDTYVSTVYPISKEKIDRYKEKSYLVEE